MQHELFIEFLSESESDRLISPGGLWDAALRCVHQSSFFHSDKQMTPEKAKPSLSWQVLFLEKYYVHWYSFYNILQFSFLFLKYNIKMQGNKGKCKFDYL